MSRLTRRQLLTTALVAPAALMLGGCSFATGPTGPVSERRARVVSTTGMINDLVLNIGGDRVDAKALMGAGVDPHLFKASERTLRTMERADLVLYNGLHLEGGLAYVLEQMGEEQPVDAVSRLIPEDRLLASADYANQHDPHLWFDVELWTMAAQAVQASLIELDAGSASLYETNGAAFLDRLRELDAWVLEQVNRLPPERRVLITAHDAFGYFGRAYGFEVLGIQGASTATEAGARDVQRLADLIAERRIPAIFVESSVPRRTVEALREAVQSRGFDVGIGGELFSDAMGDAGTEEGTYIGMIRANVTTITSALLGEEPAE